MLIKRIAITGPESTGKSTLSEQLAAHYNTVWVPEYAREYIDKLNRPYVLSDILKIAKMQLKNENLLASKANKLLICDTELIVTKIWSEHRYKSCDKWILKNIENHKYDLYLLCNIDTPWEYDPQREHPHLRQHLFDLYYNELKTRKLPFEIVSDIGNQRLENAVRFIDRLL